MLSRDGWRIWVRKNAISNIYFKLGEFHELYNCFPSKDDAANLAQFRFILRCNVYNLFNLNFTFCDVTKSSGRVERRSNSFLECNTFLLVLGGHNVNIE